VQRAGAGVDADANLGAAVSRELLLELRDFGAERELAALQDALNGGIDLGFYAGVLRFQINERYHAAAP
jgi:hypothetical protein